MQKTGNQGNVNENVSGQNKNVGGQGQTQGQGQGVGSPISNEAYNVISALHSKLEGLEAYRKYAKDAGSELWKNLTQVDVQAVSKLVDELERIVKNGMLRMQQPGGAKA